MKEITVKNSKGKGMDKARIKVNARMSESGEIIITTSLSPNATDEEVDKMQEALRNYKILRFFEG